MEIHLVADVVCPWCYIGKRQLERAFATRPSISFEVRWLPFQLNPDMPPEGMDAAAFMAHKFGASGAEAAQERIRDAGEALGLSFDFGAMKRMPNTLAAHTLIRWAGEAGRQHAVAEALYRAFFSEGADIGDAETLVGIAERCGMDRADVADRLSRNVDRDEVMAEDQALRNLGIDAVPTTIINRKRVIVGGQNPETFASLIDAEARGSDNTQ